MVSVLLPKLRLHLHIQSLGQVVIFLDIITFLKRNLLQLFSMYLELININKNGLYVNSTYMDAFQ